MTADADVHVIDDDEAVRESIDFLLRSAGLSVRTYDSAASFLDAAPTIAAGCIIITTCGCPA
jgi:two-component system, LuxR family, response regulator FixJ